MKEMIDRLKLTHMSFGRLSKGAQAFLLEYISDVGILDSSDELVYVGQIARFSDTIIYRLRPDFELPEPEIVPPEGYRIVPIEERRAKEYPTDCSVLYRGELNKTCLTSFESTGWDSACYAFAVPADYIFVEDRPTKKDPFVECNIAGEAGRYYCLITPPVCDEVDNIPLHEVESIVGFAGYKFRLSDGTETEWLEDCPCLIKDKPAELIKARFYVGGVVE